MCRIIPDTKSGLSIRTVAYDFIAFNMSGPTRVMRGKCDGCLCNFALKFYTIVYDFIIISNNLLCEKL